MAPTPNHEYSQPSKGTQDWDQPVNQNFADIDVDVEVRDSGGPTEGQNSYTPADGAKYLDTDSGVVYAGDGSAWTATHVVARTEFPNNNVGNIMLGATSNTTDGSTGNIVTGGQNNAAEGPFAAVGGGEGNSASGNNATVGGGFKNEARAPNATIAGGAPSDFSNRDLTKNIVYDEYGTIGGGGNNQAGRDNGDTTTAPFATVAGGKNNTASGDNATVGGGAGNDATANNSIVAGGKNNTADRPKATVAGGRGNAASGTEVTVGGGADNDAGGLLSTVAGGFDNETNANYATVAGGRNNAAGGQDATVAGGQGNTASGQASIAMGNEATANNDGAFVVGDSTSTSVSSNSTDEARFQQNIVSEASITTGSSYEYDGSVLSTTTFTDSDDNDIWEVETPGIYGTGFTQFSVTERGEAEVSNSLGFNDDVYDDSVQRTAGPIAKGAVQSNDSLVNGVNVTSVDWRSGPSWYSIDIEGVSSLSSNQYVLTVSPDDAVAFATGVTGADTFSVQFADDSQHGFSFVVHSLVEPES
jgi:hypothetical protein